jgi:hypothetical protein
MKSEKTIRTIKYLKGLVFSWKSTFMSTRFPSFSSEITASAQRVPRPFFKKGAGIVPERIPARKQGQPFLQAWGGISDQKPMVKLISG